MALPPVLQIEVSLIYKVPLKGSKENPETTQEVFFAENQESESADIERIEYVLCYENKTKCLTYESTE